MTRSRSGVAGPAIPAGKLWMAWRWRHKGPTHGQQGEGQT